MQHVLLECQSRARTQIWEKARGLWPDDGYQWPNITIGTILGVGQLSLPENERRQNDEQASRTIKTRGRTRLLQILISEASHLIWVIRCKRVIHKNNKQHANQEINARWLKIINDRLTVDRITATKIKRDKKHTNLVNAAWEKTLETRGILHQNWLQHREVFSG